MDHTIGYLISLKYLHLGIGFWKIKTNFKRQDNFLSRHKILETFRMIIIDYQESIVEYIFVQVNSIFI